MEKYLFILRNNPFFLGMNDEEILSILHCVNAVVITKEKDEFIFRAGDSTNTMGVVLEGTVLSIQEDLWGHRNIMKRIEVGGCFGESFAAMPGSTLNVSVITDEACKIMMLNINRLMEMCPNACEYHNKVIRNLVSVLAGKNLDLNDKITHMSKRSTRDKLTSFLSAEARRQGKLSFDIVYDRQQLADFLCVERAAMSVELSKLQKEGLIKTNRNHFELYADISD